ncbi:MAG TPA: hypothetical protein VIW24_16775 [Aldersonia sp.]
MISRWIRLFLTGFAATALTHLAWPATAFACDTTYQGAENVGTDPCGSATPMIGAAAVGTTAVAAVATVAVLNYVRGAMSAEAFQSVMTGLAAQPHLAADLASAVSGTSSAGLKVGPVDLGTRQSGTAAPVDLTGLNLEAPWPSTDRTTRLKIETALGGNLPRGTLGVDFFSEQDGGTAMSIKSIEHRGDTYRVKPSGVGSTGIRYFNDLVNYRRGGDFDPFKPPLVKPENVSRWVLRFAYPATNDPKVLRQLGRIAQHALEKDPDIVVQFVPIVG